MVRLTRHRHKKPFSPFALFAPFKLFAPLSPFALFALFSPFALFAGCAATEEVSVRPGVNAEYTDVKPETWVVRFEVESREIFRERHRIVEAVGLRAGMTVADVGAGTGLFVEPFSKAVGAAGTVLAVDITPEFLDHIQRRAEQAGLKNVKSVLCTEKSVELPRRSVDVVFVCDTYHHFEYPKHTLASIRKALKPGGEMVVIDFVRIPGVNSEWIIGHCRAGKAVFVREITEAGFELVDDGSNIDFLRENYLVRFRKSR